jgi:hypothetical protein
LANKLSRVSIKDLRREKGATPEPNSFKGNLVEKLRNLKVKERGQDRPSKMGSNYVTPKN